MAFTLFSHTWSWSLVQQCSLIITIYTLGHYAPLRKVLAPHPFSPSTFTLIFIIMISSHTSGTLVHLRCTNRDPTANPPSPPPTRCMTSRIKPPGDPSLVAHDPPRGSLLQKMLEVGQYVYTMILHSVVHASFGRFAGTSESSMMRVLVSGMSPSRVLVIRDSSLGKPLVRLSTRAHICR